MWQAPAIPAFPAKLQELDPKQARFCLKAERFLQEEGVSLKKRRVLVAFSGGADSSALVLCLYYLSRKLDFSLCVAHLDHALRPSSAAEAAYCQAFCTQLGLAFVARRTDIRAACAKSGLGTEEAAREARYDFFAAQAAKNGCGVVALGHNAGDLAEDILMRLLRGSGWPGLCGMAAVDEERGLVRPLLRHTRAEIEAFVAGFGAGWLHDESNDDHSYLRNRVRHVLLPLFLRENPAFLDAAAGLNMLGRFDEDWFTTLVAEELAKAALPTDKTGAEASPEALFVPQTEASPESRRKRQSKTRQEPLAEAAKHSLFFSSEQLENLPKALRLRLYKAALDKLGPGQARLDNLLRLEAGWLSALRSGSGETKRFQFPGDKCATVTAAGIGWYCSSAVFQSSGPEESV